MSSYSAAVRVRKLLVETLGALNFNLNFHISSSVSSTPAAAVAAGASAVVSSSSTNSNSGPTASAASKPKRLIANSQHSSKKLQQRRVAFATTDTRTHYSPTPAHPPPSASPSSIVSYSQRRFYHSRGSESVVLPDPSSDVSAAVGGASASAKVTGSSSVGGAQAKPTVANGVGGVVSGENGTAGPGTGLPSWFDRRSTSIFEIFEKAVPQTRRTYRFQHAASAIPKNGSLAQLALASSKSKSVYSSSPSSRLPNDDSSRFLSVQCGEDSYFSRHDALGVADGVGGWVQVKGANPALYSLKLMHYASLELERYDDIANNEYDIDDYYNLDPALVLERAYENVCRDAEEEGLVGSCTALIVVLRNDELRIANLGDCGLMVLRNLVPIFRTEEQQHSFNFPYQLGTGSRDSPTDAQSFVVK
ncbi:hypothetical protein HK102_012896, partial [Quaeritorhiza haematococci]